MAEKILVIDDEETTVQLIGILLERRGYEIIKAFLHKMKARMSIDGSNGTNVELIITKFKTTD